jgi:hypothetical protein
MRRLKRSIGTCAALAALAGRARADDWTGHLEAGAEVDSNVRRVEVGASSDEAPTTAGLARLGGRVAGTGHTGWGTWTIGGTAQARAVAAPAVAGESVAALAGQARWDVPIPHHAARAFVRVDGYDVVALGDGVGARAFSTRAAEAGVVATDGERRITIAGGGRDFTYKPDADFDWRGPSVALRLDAPVWHGHGEVSAPVIELSLDYRLERRRFRGLAFANGCAPGAVPMPACYVPTTSARADLHHAARALLTYTGERVWSIGYELTVDDSTSYGQSVTRHRALASVTARLPARFVVSASAILELDHYPAPLVVARGVASQAFSSIDDDNRSTGSLLLARPITGQWSAELRYAYWTDALATDGYAFHRQLAYAGLVWGQAR